MPMQLHPEGPARKPRLAPNGLSQPSRNLSLPPLSIARAPAFSVFPTISSRTGAHPVGFGRRWAILVIPTWGHIPFPSIAIRRSIHIAVRSSESHPNQRGLTEQAPMLVFSLKEAAPFRASSKEGLANLQSSTLAVLHGALAVSLKVSQIFTKLAARHRRHLMVNLSTPRLRGQWTILGQLQLS